MRFKSQKKQNAFVFEMDLSAAYCLNTSRCISEMRLNAFNHHFETKTHLCASINVFGCVQSAFQFDMGRQINLLVLTLTFQQPIKVEFQLKVKLFCFRAKCKKYSNKYIV
jgi:hypothetical protein